MDELLTIAEIEAKYPDEWVLLADPEVRKGPKVIRGTVVFHSPDRDQLDKRATELKLKSSAVRFTGKLPEHMAFNL